MANNKNDAKKKIAKKAAKKVTKKAATQVAKNVEQTAKERKKEPRRSMACKILPYFLMVFALILAVCLFMVHLLGLEDGVGTIGYAIQWFFGGIFGGATVLLPATLGYVGLKWCLYNIKWKDADMNPKSEYYNDYRKARKRLVLQIVMTSLALLTISIMFGVGADYRSFDLADMWDDGAYEMIAGGGGILGSTLGYLMLEAFEALLSFIILSVLLLLFVILMLGLTPDYIVTKLQEHRIKAKEAKAFAAEERRAEEARIRAENERRTKEMRQSAYRATAAVAAENPSKTAPPPADFDEDSFDVFAEDTPDLIPPDETLIEPEIPVRPIPGTEPQKKNDLPSVDDIIEQMNQRIAGQDFGDDTASEAAEPDNLEEFFKTLGAEKQKKAEPKEPAKKEKSKASAKPLDMTEIGTDELLSDLSDVTPEEQNKKEVEEEEEPATPYVFPPIDLLAKNKNKEEEDYTAELQENARQLVSTLQSFRINIKEINYSRGPTITRYELRPDAGVRVRSIANLVDDIALSLATSGVRIEAPIPGKAAVGIEVPNRNRATVYLRDLIENPQFTDAKSKLTASLGMDVGGNPIYFDVSKMPHMIIAGATGMGKSVCINSIIISILYKAKPEDVKLILIDPKKVEFNMYKDMPHLYAPIVSDPKKAAGALASAVAEMERRFELIEEVGVRDIASYNAATANDPYKEHMPHMVIIIDELADLMMTAPDDVETAICRLAQKARAAGIHIIIGTQRPSVDVITGLIKANIPSRIACTVASQVDSRTIIDIAGAEKLIGRGDMLFAPVGASKPIRVQGAFVSDTEVENVTTFVRENNTKAKYNSDFMNRLEEAAAGIGQKKSAGGESFASAEVEGGDDKFAAAVKLAVEEGKISTSLMQRRLGVGYGRAAKIIDTMEEMGYVSKPDGNKPRRVLLTAEEYARRVTEGTLGGDEE